MVLRFKTSSLLVALDLPRQSNLVCLTVCYLLDKAKANSAHFKLDGERLNCCPADCSQTTKARAGEPRRSQRDYIFLHLWQCNAGDVATWCASPASLK